MTKDISTELNKDFLKDPDSGFYPIHRAAKYGKGTLSELKRLINKGADLEVRTPWERTPLIMACIDWETRKVKLLLEAGANINASDHEGDTPLHAAIYGSNSLTQLLVDNGADIEARNLDGLTPLGHACEIGKQGAIEILCEAGANVNDEYSTKSLLFRALEGKHNTPPTSLYKIFKTLKDYGADVEFIQASTGNSILHLTAELTQIDYSAWGVRFTPICRTLINSGLNPWLKNINGESPIQIMDKWAPGDLKPALKKYIKNNIKNIIPEIETEKELTCFYENQSEYSRSELFDLLTSGTEAKNKFDEIIKPEVYENTSHNKLVNKI